MNLKDLVVVKDAQDKLGFVRLRRAVETDGSKKFEVEDFPKSFPDVTDWCVLADGTIVLLQGGRTPPWLTNPSANHLVKVAWGPTPEAPYPAPVISDPVEVVGSFGTISPMPVGVGGGQPRVVAWDGDLINVVRVNDGTILNATTRSECPPLVFLSNYVAVSRPTGRVMVFDALTGTVVAQSQQQGQVYRFAFDPFTHALVMDEGDTVSVLSLAGLLPAPPTQLAAAVTARYVLDGGIVSMAVGYQARTHLTTVDAAGDVFLHELQPNLGIDRNAGWPAPVAIKAESLTTTPDGYVMALRVNGELVSIDTILRRGQTRSTGLFGFSSILGSTWDKGALQHPQSDFDGDGVPNEIEILRRWSPLPGDLSLGNPLYMNYGPPA